MHLRSLIVAAVTALAAGSLSVLPVATTAVQAARTNDNYFIEVVPDTPQVQAGETVWFSLRVQSRQGKPAGGVNVKFLSQMPMTNALPAGWSRGTDANGVDFIMWNNLTIDHAHAETLRIAISVPADFPAGTFQVAGWVWSNNSDGLDEGLLVTVIPRTFDVSIGKSGPAQVLKGQTIGYSLAAVNHGPGTARGVVVRDQIPQDLVFDSAAPGNDCSLQGATVVCNLGNLTRGESRAIPITLRTTDAVSCGTVVTNTATIAAAGDTNAGNNTAYAHTTVTCPASSVASSAVSSVAFSAASSVTSSAASSAAPLPGCIDVTVETFNEQNTPVFPVEQFTVSLDGGQTTFTNAGGNTRFNSVTTTIHSVSTVQVAQKWTLVSVTPANGAVQVQPGPACSAVVFKYRLAGGLPSQLTITKDDDEDEAEPGDTLTYEIVVKNPTNLQITNVTVVDTLPDELEFDEASDNGVHSGNTVTWSNLTFGPGETRTFTLEADIDEDLDEDDDDNDDDDDDGEIDIVNKVEIVNGPSDTDTTTVELGDAGLTVEKTASQPEVFAGDTIEYTIEIENTGDRTIEDIEIIDELFSGDVTLLDDGDADESRDGRLEWSIDELEPGDTETFTYRVIVSANELPGTEIRNEVEVTADDIEERDDAVVYVIGEMPQTGIGQSGSGSPYLRRISGDSSTGNPLAAASASVGTILSIGAFALKRFLRA